jgi:cytochrome c oxidase subunit II
MIDWIEHSLDSFFPPVASSYAGDIDFVFSFVFWIVVAFWFMLVQGAFFYLVMRYRKKPGVKALYITGETTAQHRAIAWPHYVIILCDIVIVAAAIRVWYNVKQALPPADETVRIVAQQWAWSFVHPGPDGKLDTADDIRTVDELHLEVGKNYHYLLEARDVLHSLSIPVFRLKQDAIPGRVVTGWFRPTVPGQHDLQCAEICGIGHGLMPARVILETPEQHAAWMASQAGTGAPAAGE